MVFLGHLWHACPTSRGLVALLPDLSLRTLERRSDKLGHGATRAQCTPFPRVGQAGQGRQQVPGL